MFAREQMWVPHICPVLADVERPKAPFLIAGLLSPSSPSLQPSMTYARPSLHHTWPSPRQTRPSLCNKRSRLTTDFSSIIKAQLSRD